MGHEEFTRRYEASSSHCVVYVYVVNLHLVFLRCFCMAPKWPVFKYVLSSGFSLYYEYTTQAVRAGVLLDIMWDPMYTFLCVLCVICSSSEFCWSTNKTLEISIFYHNDWWVVKIDYVLYLSGVPSPPVSPSLYSFGDSTFWRRKCCYESNLIEIRAQLQVGLQRLMFARTQDNLLKLEYYYHM
jgi:hypothetical protein